ncbi:hypothetical protein [Streptomyces sp. SGAir0957]
MPTVPAPHITWTDLDLATNLKAIEPVSYGILGGSGHDCHIAFRGAVEPATGGNFPVRQAVWLGALPEGFWSDVPTDAPDGKYIGRSLYIGAKTATGGAYLGKLNIGPTGQLAAYLGVPATSLYLNGVFVHRPVPDGGPCPNC